jgi:hypothetical protein
VLIFFSSITILLACVALFDALRSSAPRWVAVTVLAPLGLFSAIHMEQAGRYWLGLPGVTEADVYLLGVYFRPVLLVNPDGLAAGWRLIGWSLSGSMRGAFVVEAVKWCAVLAIAIWLTMAQLAVWRRGSVSSS